MQEWLGQNWGNVLSLIGLAYAIYCARQAQSAAEAAKEASEKTERAMAVQECLHAVAECRRLNSEMSSLLTSRAYSAAQIRTQDLASSLRFLSKRWGNELNDTAIDLTEACALVDSIGEKLQTLQNKMASTAEHKRLVLISQRVSNAIVSAQALAEKRGSKNAQ